MLNTILAPHPTRFWQSRPSLPPTEIVGRVGTATLRFTLSTDEFGHRTMPPAVHARTTVLFLGDSCTLGLGVNDDQTFVALLQSHMEGVRCVNAGVPGYTAYQGRATLDEWLQRTRDAGRNLPNIVVIEFGFNDSFAWDQLSDPDHAELLNRSDRFVDHSGFVRMIRSWLMPALANPPPVAVTPAREPGATSQSAADGASRGPRPNDRPRLNEAEFDEQLRLIVDRSRDIGAEPVLVIWPQPSAWKRAVLANLAKKKRVRLVDLASIFAAHREPGLFLDVVHASPAGHIVAANALGPVIAEIVDAHAPSPAGS